MRKTPEKLSSLVRKRLPAPSWHEEDASIPTRAVQAQKLWGMVRKYTGHPLLVDFLAALIERDNVPERDPEALVKAIQAYSVNEIKFFREYPERFQSPLRTIAWGIGDCDDKTIFVAASARTFRIPTRLSVLTLDHEELDLAHVYPEVWIGGKWIPVDTVRAYPWGHDPAKVALQKDLLLRQQFIGDAEPEDPSYA